MGDNFKDYADYYNLLYQDKEYNLEVQYIISLIEKFRGNSNSILDLGCGTGKHDFLLAESGYSVTGVDLSSDMIGLAKQGLRKDEVKFIVGDARELRTNNTYDIILALFHVLSYQNTNDDIIRFFETAKSHMTADSIFIFDFWYGPGVLSDPPHVRTKEMHNDDYKGIRKANPEMHPNENIVDVNYELTVTELKTSKSFEINEKHRMRYFFQPELQFIYKELGFEFVSSFEWMSFKQPSLVTWNVVNIIKLK